MILRKNNEQDPAKKYANDVYNLTQIEAEIKSLGDSILATTTNTIASADIQMLGPWVDVRGYSSFAAAITAIGATQATLLIPDHRDVVADVTVPANITLQFLHGGHLSIANAKFVTINGQIEAGIYQIFDCAGTGNVVFAVGSVIYPEWWGAIGDGATDDKNAFAYSVASITSKGEIVLDRTKTYLVSAATAIGTKTVRIHGGGTIKLGGDISGFTVDGGQLELIGLYFTTASSGTGIAAEALSPSVGIMEYNTITDTRGGFHFFWNNSLFRFNTITMAVSIIEGHYGIHMPGSGNKVINNSMSGGRHAVYVSGGASGNAAVENNIVEGNLFTGITTVAITMYAAPTQGAIRYNRIMNNIISDTVGGHAISLSTNSYGNTISGNTINGFIGGHGISIEGQGGTTDAGTRPYQNIISGNTIISKVVDELTWYNISLLNAYNNTIIGNMLIHPQATTAANVLGINVTSQNPGNEAYGNRVMNNSFTMCRLNNATIDNTEILGNTFKVAPLQVPISIGATGTAIVGDNALGDMGMIINFADGDTSPSVKNGCLFRTANTGGTSITFFDDGYLGQEITVIFNDANTTMVNATTMMMLGNTDKTFAAKDIATFIKTVGNVWREKSRSVN